MKTAVALAGTVIFIVALVLMYIVFAGISSNADGNFAAFVTGLAGLLIGAIMAFFGFAYQPAETK